MVRHMTLPTYCRVEARLVVGLCYEYENYISSSVVDHIIVTDIRSSFSLHMSVIASWQVCIDGADVCKYGLLYNRLGLQPNL